MGGPFAVIKVKSWIADSLKKKLSSLRHGQIPKESHFPDSWSSQTSILLTKSCFNNLEMDQIENKS